MTMDRWDTHNGNLTGLELAKYVLIRLVDNPSVEKLAEEFDNDVGFINSIVGFLKNVKWIEQDDISGLYQITEVGKIKTNTSTIH
jgi:hypothetical protein